MASGNTTLSGSSEVIGTHPADSEVLSHVQALSQARILCVGDVMLDRFIYGKVDRISPEAPIPIISVEEENAMLGGAGNVVRNLTALGAKVWFVSVVGADDAGHEITKLVGREKDVEPYLTVETDRRTTVKERFVSGGQQLFRADRETITPVDGMNKDTILELAESSMEDVDMVILSDYQKGTLTPDIAQALIKKAKAKGLWVICDPKGRDYSKYAGCDFITPNRRELGEASGLPVNSFEEVVKAAQALRHHHGIGSVLATLSEEGMALVAEETVFHVTSEAREVYDVSGAGDTVLATLAASVAAGLSAEESVAMANAAAGIVVGKIGTAVVHAAELSRSLRQHADHTGGKVILPENLQDDVARWRRNGLKVGFTNGCFDLVHPGHVSLLRQARQACDRLIVGLNTDQSVRRLKGAGRPIQDEDSRAEVLAAIASVDRVVLFDDDTPLNLIKMLRPDVLIKGADYTIATVVGAEIVQGYGGTILLADITPGKSTTSMVHKMAETTEQAPSE